MDIRKLMSLASCMAVALSIGFATGCEQERVTVDERQEEYRYSAPEREADVRGDYEESWEADMEADQNRDLEGVSDIDADIDIDRDYD